MHAKICISVQTLFIHAAKTNRLENYVNEDVLVQDFNYLTILLAESCRFV